jgi:thiosulfate sulfurtransferase
MADFKFINANDAVTRLADMAIVDIRDPQSYAMGHIPGALRLDNSNVATFIGDTQTDKPVLVVCYHGNSSQGAAQYLAEQGFQEVYSLNGGFEFWRAQFPEKVEA